MRLLGLVARTRLTLSRRSTPASRSAHVVRQTVPTPWARKGVVMREVLEAAGDREVDTTDGVRVVEPDGGWALVLPDPSEAVTHLWAEGPTAESAEALLAPWAASSWRPADEDDGRRADAGGRAVAGWSGAADAALRPGASTARCRCSSTCMQHAEDPAYADAARARRRPAAPDRPPPGRRRVLGGALVRRRWPAC